MANLSTETPKQKSKLTGGEALAATDPLLSIGFIMEDLGIGRWAFNKSVRPGLSIVRVSARKNRVRRSDYETWKAARTKPAIDA